MSRTVVRRSIAAAVIVVVGYVALRVYLAGFDVVPPAQNTVPVTVGGGIARGERISSHSWSIDYQKITTSEDQSYVTVDGVRHGVVYKDGKPYLNLRAAHVSVNMITHDFTASGPIHVQSVNPNNPRSFDTTAAVWTEATQRLELPQPIVVTTPGTSQRVAKLTHDNRTGQLHLDQIGGSLRE
jgi:predicted membrane-bound mannosyltransferase